MSIAEFKAAVEAELENGGWVIAKDALDLDNGTAVVLPYGQDAERGATAFGYRSMVQVQAGVAIDQNDGALDQAATKTDELTRLLWDSPILLSEPAIIEYDADVAGVETNSRNYTLIVATVVCRDA